ncbi:TPA: hypothetical protein N0F65_002765, partial [Lagenidium giganteum]
GTQEIADAAHTPQLPTSAAANDASAKAPARTVTKKRAASSATGSAAKPRVTRRELKKLTEMDLEEKDEVPVCGDGWFLYSPPADSFACGTASARTFGVDSASTMVTPSSLHDDFINLMKAQGLEKMATEAGLMKDGSLVDIKKEPEVQVATTERSTPNGKRTLGMHTPDVNSPGFSSPSSAKKRKLMKINKGLRHFSMKVCQKVEEKNVTTYNEVADELVQEFTTMRPNDSAYDEKNIRRRVYDALNVLMAMDIISKERKEIRWRGLPSNLQHDTEMLLAERNERLKSVEQKKQHLQDLLVQQIAMKNLLKRNADRRKSGAESAAMREEGRIFLPFIVVNTGKDTVIQCEMSEDRQDIFFNFSAPFEINDDTEILRRLNLHQCSRNEAQRLVPESLFAYLPGECDAGDEVGNAAVTPTTSASAPAP